MVSTTVFDHYQEQLAAGERLTPDVVRSLAAAPDILPLGMLADVQRRRIHGTRTTYLRVAPCAFDGSFSEAIPGAAAEVRITGVPSSFDVALAAVQAARAAAGDRTVSGFSWQTIAALADGAGAPRADVLRQLRDAGLDAIAELPIDTIHDLTAAVEQLQETGFSHLRLTVDKVAAADRTDLLLQLFDVQHRCGCIAAVNPLPLALNAFRPTTGYEDVKMVAVARLAVPNIPHVQVDWVRYGPKLAQVALTFGADDLDGVSASDEAPEGRRRAPVEDIRRNIQAAGFEPVERGGRFSAL
jgi:aminodeoxyfutalosine synthase